MTKTEVTKHDNEPLFEPGKAYKLTDGTNRRVLIQAVETTRVKADEVEFNQHRYRAVVIERGDKLSTKESALVATVKTKACKVTKAELAQYEMGPPGKTVAGAVKHAAAMASEAIKSEGSHEEVGGASPPAAEPDQTTSGDAQPREPEEAARESESGEAVSPAVEWTTTTIGEVEELRAFRDAIHEQWQHLELESGISLVAAVEGALTTARLEATAERDETIGQLTAALDEATAWLEKHNEEKQNAGLPLGLPIDQSVAEVRQSAEDTRCAWVERVECLEQANLRLVKDLCGAREQLETAKGGENEGCVGCPYCESDRERAEVKQLDKNPGTPTPAPRSGVFLPDGLSWYQLGRFVGTRLIRQRSLVVDAAQVKTIGGHPTIREDTPDDLATPETEQAGSDAHERAPK